MAVALEVGWGRSDLGGLAHMSKKRAWGDDHQKLLEMMMGKPFDEAGNGSSRHTLDLLGSASSSVSASEQSDFLELGQELPLPSGWEKRLDLKSGTVFFINWNTGKTTYNDPRNAQSSFPSPPCSASCHMSLELLQTELGKQSSSSSSVHTKNAIENGRARSGWDHLDADAAAAASGIDQKSALGENGGLDLKLNLASKQESSNAAADVTQLPEDHPVTECLWLLPASSSPKSKISTPAPAGCDVDEAQVQDAVANTNKVTLTGCKRCLMYVMISQSDPRCPKCGSSVIIDFPIVKKPRFDLEL